MRRSTRCGSIPRHGRDVIVHAEQDVGIRDDVILAMAKDIVYTHHEKWDGTGYPQGLRGTSIPIAGRLMALVDVYDAITSRRVYREPMSHEEAVAFIVSGRGTHFDPVGGRRVRQSRAGCRTAFTAVGVGRSVRLQPDFARSA